MTRYLTAEEAAEIARIHIVNFRKKCRLGKIPGAVKLDSRWKVPEDFMERVGEVNHADHKD